MTGSSLRARAAKIAAEIEREQHLVVPRGTDFYEVIGYDPRPLQAELDRMDRRFNARVLHRRFGKTVREIAKVMRRAYYCPFDDGRYAYLGPTYSQVEDIAWLYLERYHERFMRYFERDPEKYRHAGKMYVWMPTSRGGWSRIRLYGVDSPKQRLRGAYLDGCVLDEFAWIPPSVWTEQVRPMLADEERRGVDEEGARNQWADFIFTPYGRNHAHALFKRAELWSRGEAVREFDPQTEREYETFSDEWSAALYRASETGVLSKAELRAQLHEMGRARYEQEFECSFDAAVEGAIYAREIEELRQQGRVTRVPVNPLLPVHTAWDLGWDDATAVWFFQENAGEIRVVDYLEATGASIQRLVEMLAERGYRYGYHLMPWDVEVEEMGTGRSRRSIFQECGLRPSVVRKHSIHDGIAAARVLLERCLFDANRCAEGLDRLALYRREYDERKGVYREKPMHDWASHGADAFRTLAMGKRLTPPTTAPDPNRMTHAEM